MSAAAILAVVVAVGDGQGALAGALVATASEALAPAAIIELREVSLPSDDEALRVEQDLGARGVVKLVWMDTAHEDVRIRLHVARTDHWTERRISFATADTVKERGRALGFAIASMLPEAAPELVPDTFLDAMSDPVGLPRWGLGVAAIGSTGLDGPAGGLGAALDLEWFTERSVSLRLTAGARGGTIPDLGATNLAAFAGVGAAWWPVPARTDQRLGLAVRADALALYHSVSRATSGGGTERHGRLLPGADLLVELSWLFGTSVQAVVSGGVEFAFGSRTEVAVGNDVVTTIAPIRGVATVGLRLRF
jgi:hypothetical protein